MELAAEKYRQTEVGLIPSDWDIFLLEELTTKIGSGITPTGGSTVYKEDGRPFIRSQNIGWGNLLLDDIAFIDDETHQTFPNTEIKINDVFLNISGASIGRSSFANEKLVGGNVNQHVCIIRVIDKKLNPNYLNLFLLSKNGQKQIDSFQSGGNRQGLNIGQIKTFQIPIPPTIEEQTAIATALSDADALISSLSKLIAKKRNIKQGAMQKLLNPMDNGELIMENEGNNCQLSINNYQLKKGWEVKKLGEILGRVTTGKLDANAMKENGEYRFYTCAKDYYFIDEYAFDTEALMVSGNGANVGYIHYYKGKFNAYQRTYVLTDFSIDVFYIKLYLDSYLKDRITTEVSAGNTPYIKMDTITDMIIHYPSNTEEQTRIATILSDMDAEISALETKLEKYKKVKLGMMQNLLTGKIRLV